MDAVKVHKYWKAIAPIEARESLLQLKLLEYPMLKKGPREKLRSSLMKEAYPNTKTYLSIDELKERLSQKAGG